VHYWLSVNMTVVWFMADYYWLSVNNTVDGCMVYRLVVVVGQNGLSVVGIWITFVLVMGSDVMVAWDLVQKLVSVVSLIWVNGQAKVYHIAHKGVTGSVDVVEFFLKLLKSTNVE